MYLWRTKVRHRASRPWRWALVVRPTSLSLNSEAMLSGAWRPVGRYVSVFLARSWKFGEDHCYYDGPHCLYLLGFLRIAWSWNWCEKCHPSACCTPKQEGSP